MNGIYRKSIKQRIERFFEKVHECIHIYRQAGISIHFYICEICVRQKKDRADPKNRENRTMNQKLH